MILPQIEQYSTNIEWTCTKPPSTASGAIRRASVRETQKPAPPVANQKEEFCWERRFKYKYKYTWQTKRRNSAERCCKKKMFQILEYDMEFSHRSGLWMNDLERRGGGGLAEVPRLVGLVLVEGVEERGHVDVVVVVEVAPPLLVRTEKVLKLLQNN